MKYIINFLILFFVNYQTLALSNEIYKLKIPNNFKINLEKSENRKFITNYIKAALHLGPREDIDPYLIKQKYKKWFRGNLIIKDNNKLNNYEIKIRLMGDYKDHIDIENTRASLKVTLINKTLNGVKTFRLYLPNTREDTNEVFINLLLKYVGFPTLYTKIVNVEFLGQKYRAIFQEEGSKEFLERNYFYELPILKTGEYHFNLNKKSLKRKKLIYPYIINNSGILKKENSSDVINEAIYLAHSKNFKNLIYHNEFFEKILTYLGGDEAHGLIDHNRRYIYLPLNRIFIPLYYDGNIKYMNVNKVNCEDTLYLNNFQKFKFDYETLSKKKISNIEICIFNEIYGEYLKIYSKKKHFLAYQPLENSKIIPGDNIIKINNISNSYLKNNQNNFKKEFNRFDKYYYQNNNKFYKCFYSDTENIFKYCKIISLDEYKEISYKRPKIDKVKDIFSTHLNIGLLNLNNRIKMLEIEELNNENIILEDPVTYYINLNYLKNRRNIIFKNLKSRLILFGKGTNIELNIFSEIKSDLNQKLKFERTDSQLLTGCVTFYYAQFKNINLNLSDLFCEDSINFLYSEGDIENIKVFNSLSDAIDADFSELNIKNISINNSKNDCSDFSFGKYVISKGSFNNCGDKALSFGEMSYGVIKKIQISNSFDGVVAKDDSIVNVNEVNAKNIKNYCFAAYNKKPEFGGGSLTIDSYMCEGSRFKDLKSKLFINE